MWAEMSDKATNARQSTAPDTHVQNAILDIDAAKIRKDVETEIRNEKKLRQQKAYHGSEADKVRFFRTSDGHAYGFTYNGKVYIYTNSATAETPMHEYSHLWASAFRKSNPKEPTKKPLHWVAIKFYEKSPIVVLEVNDSKDNTEIVGWYTLDDRNLERIKRQANKNGGELIVLSPKDKVESLSTPLNDLSLLDKDNNNSVNSQKKDVKKKMLRRKKSKSPIRLLKIKLSKRHPKRIRIFM